MAGEVDLRDDFDASGLREGHDILDVVSRVVLSAGRQFEQFWRPKDLDAPGLIVCQFPLEDVELAEGHLLEDLFQFLDGHEVPGAVDLQTADVPAGFVGHGAEVGIVEVRQLVQRRQRADDALFRGRLHGDALFPDGQVVLFCLLRVDLVQEQPGLLFRLRVSVLHRDAGAFRERGQTVVFEPAQVCHEGLRELVVPERDADRSVDFR